MGLRSLPCARSAGPEREEAPHAQLQEDTDGDHVYTTEALLEQQFLNSAAEAADAPRRLCPSRPALVGGAAVVALLVVAAAWTISPRSLPPAWRSPDAVSLTTGNGLINLDVTLVHLPYGKLAAETSAKHAVGDAVLHAFQGRLPHCQVASEVVAHLETNDATVVKITLVPTDGSSAENMRSLVEGDGELEVLSALIEDATNSLAAIDSVTTGEVQVSSIAEAQQQDGDLQHSVADIQAGSNIVPMGGTSIREGDVVYITYAGGPEQEVTVTAVKGGNLEVQPPLSSSYPTGSLVVIIPPEMQETPEPTPAPRPTPAPSPFPEPSPAEGEIAKEASVGVTQTVVLNNLPSSKLDAEWKKQIEQEVQKAYVEVLDVAPQQVTAKVMLPDGRKLLLEETSGSSTETEVQVGVEPSEGQSVEDLEAQMESSADALNAAIASNVEEVRGIDSIKLGPITATTEFADRDGDDQDKVKQFLQRGIIAAIVVLTVCMCCMLKAHHKKGQESKTGTPEEAPRTEPSEEDAASSEADQEETADDEYDIPGSGGLHIPATEPEQHVAFEAQHVPTQTRDELIAKVFENFDTDCDRVLNQAELKMFAETCCGFCGSDSEWVEDYTAICQEYKVSQEHGIPFENFKALVNDHAFGLDEDAIRDGEVSVLYCDDEDLRKPFATD